MSRRQDLPVVHCDRCRGPIYRGEWLVSTLWPVMFGVFAAAVLVAVLGLLVLGLAVRGLL